MRVASWRVLHLQHGYKFNRIQVAHNMCAGIYIVKNKVVDAYLNEPPHSVGILTAADDKFRPYIFSDVACKIIGYISPLGRRGWTLLGIIRKGATLLLHHIGRNNTALQRFSYRWPNVLRSLG